MKRKLDANDAPVVSEEVSEDVPEHIPEDMQEDVSEEQHSSGKQPLEGASASAEPASLTSFGDFHLDFTLLQATTKLNYVKPTLVQQRAIPLILDGKDVLAKARTGTGKTAAYLLPIMQMILKRKQKNEVACTSALILVPTRELADQVTKAVDELATFCGREISSLTLTNKIPDSALRALLARTPDIVVSTPSRAWHAAKSAYMSLAQLKHLVLDEADLVLSYGHSEDLKNISDYLPKNIQTILMSATLSTDVDTLKGMLCDEPTVLDLEEKETEGGGVLQFYTKCAEDDKFLLAYVIFKLKLVTGKCIIFVANVDRCYRLKLFFEQFGIRSCILNSELPVNSRIHCIEEFNRNVYDIMIASDELEVLGDEGEPAVGADGAAGKAKKARRDSEPPKKMRKAARRDKEFGVSRGIDFKNVEVVVNFDLPTSAKSYMHRIGRTARAGRTGMALSFVVPSELYRKHMPTSVETAANDEKVLRRIIKQQGKVDKEVKPYNFDMKQMDAFRYRMNDALRSVTSVAVREARTREIRQQLAKSEKLKRHFEENPGELANLARHDHELRPMRTQAHLKHVPDYLLPHDGKNALTDPKIGSVSLRRTDGKDRRKRSKYYKKKTPMTRFGQKKTRDPLKTFRSTSKVQKK